MAAYTRPTTIKAYKEQLKGLIGARTTSGSNFPLTAFANETDIRVGETTHATPLTTLNVIGEGFQRYRGYRAPQGRTPEKNFQGDHDWFKNGNSRPSGVQQTFNDSNRTPWPVIDLPKRASFGLPHNYFSVSPSLQMKINATDDGKDRRASPLMFHIHKLSDREFFGVAVFIPTLFLYNSEIKVDHNSKKYSFDTKVIISFLDNKKPSGSPAASPYFPSTKLFP